MATINFHTIWIGVAGYDRPIVANSVDSALSKLFNRSVGKRLRVSSDIDLLVTSAASTKNLDSAVVLVAGTGSVAMSYELKGGKLVRTGRSGGWGHLLGDDGSGYGIGREALRMALDAAESQNMDDNEPNQIDPLIERIFQHFGLSTPASSEIELLNRVLSPESGQDRNQAARKIAEVGKVVLQERETSDAANRIIWRGCNSLVQIVSSLIGQRKLDVSTSTLVLAGGLLQNRGYRESFLEILSAKELQFNSIKVVENPAMAGAKNLLTTIHTSI